eukprot:Lithocolla_globosa_v1_NODE_597_length_3629_cov_4.882205.p1 type:complete len:792 gc:universal NODE_597_length_3629_cov_4.882205:2932-557(-)
MYCVRTGKVAKLLHLKDGTPQPQESDLSSAQVSRLYSQGLAVAAFFSALHQRDKEILEVITQTLSHGDSCLGSAELLNCSIHIEEIRLTRNKPEIAAAIASMYHISGDTILNWQREYEKYNGFEESKTGSWLREWILYEEDLLRKFRTWLRSEKHVSKTRACQYINCTLLASEGMENLLVRYKLTLPIAEATAHSWMVKAGAAYSDVKKCYYTDTHNKPETIADRGRYITELDRLSLRLPLWFHVPVEQCPPSLLDSGYLFKDDIGGADMVELHVDRLGKIQNQDLYCELREQMGPDGGLYSVRFPLDAPCEYDRPPETCRCHQPAYHIGQDESIFKAYLKSSKEWVLQGVRSMNKKSDGPGEMVSAFQDEIRGFGLPMTPEELFGFNQWRKARGKAPVQDSPGLRFLLYGKDKEGYWNNEKMKIQVEDVMDAIEYLYDDKQQIIEVDWSSGHAMHKPDGLHVSNMNVSYGGKQKKLRESIVTQDCLGNSKAIMTWHGRQIDLKLQPGDVQSMIFKEGDPPPWYFPDCPPYDAIHAKKPKKTISEKAQKKSKGKRQQAVSSATAAAVAASSISESIAGVSPSVASAVKAAASAASAAVTAARDAEGELPFNETDNIIEGYIGKAKGKKQILWERGLWLDGMTASQEKPELNIDKVLQSCGDFLREKSALQAVVEDRGHILLMCIKGHPELAGLGVEYSWGKGKLEFRRNINDEIPAHLHDNILKCLSTDVLPLSRVRKFARRTREYRAVYADPALAADSTCDGYALIEKMRKTRKTHRNIVDIEARYILQT